MLCQNTKILTYDGIATIDELFENPQAVIAYDTKNRFALFTQSHDHQSKISPKEVCEISFHNGYSILATKGQYFYCMKKNWRANGGYEWKRASELKTGTELCTHHEQICSENRRIAKVESVKIVELKDKPLFFKFGADRYHNVLVSANEEDSMFVVARMK